MRHVMLLPGTHSPLGHNVFEKCRFCGARGELEIETNVYVSNTTLQAWQLTRSETISPRFQVRNVFVSNTSFMWPLYAT